MPQRFGVEMGYLRTAETVVRSQVSVPANFSPAEPGLPPVPGREICVPGPRSTREDVMQRYGMTATAFENVEMRTFCIGLDRNT